MVAKYRIGGGTANFTDNTKWSLSSGGANNTTAPTSADDAFLDANSGAGTITVSTGTAAKSLTCTGFTGTLAGASNATVNLYGNLVLSTGMTLTFQGYFRFNASGSINTVGKTIGLLDVVGSGVTLTLASAVTCSDGILVRGGTLNTSASNYALSCSYLTSTGSSTITLNGSTVTCTYGISNAAAWSVSSTTTINSGTSTISLTGAVALFDGGGKTYNRVTTSATTQLGVRDAGNTFTNLTLTSPTATGTTFHRFFGNQTIGTLIASGTSITQRIGIYGSAGSWTIPLIGSVTLTVTTWTTKSDIDFSGITASGAAWSGTRLGDAEGNSNITFPTPKTVYWNLAGTNDVTATGWATTSGGTPAANNFPLPQDTIIFDNSSAGTQVNIVAGFNYGTVDSSARSTALALTLNGTFYVLGNWSNGSGLTITATGGNLAFNSRNSRTLKSAGKFPTSNNISIVGGGTLLLLDNLSTVGNFTLQYGTLNADGYSVQTFRFLIQGGAASKTLAFGTGGVWTIDASGSSAWNTSAGSVITITGSVRVDMTSASAKTFGGLSLNYSGMTLNQAGAGTLTVTGSNTFANITNTYAATGATTISLTAGTTQTVSSFTASGAPGKLLTLQSTTPGTRATLSDASGAINVSYLNIKDIAATGGASWTATDSIDGGNNTGWVFQVGSSGNFLFFFG